MVHAQMSQARQRGTHIVWWKDFWRAHGYLFVELEGSLAIYRHDTPLHVNGLVNALTFGAAQADAGPRIVGT